MTLSRSSAPRRVTPLPRKKPLPSGTPLARSPFPRPRLSLVKAEGAAVLAPAQWQRKRGTDTGFPRSVKLAVRKRAGNGAVDEARCEATGVWLGRYGGEIQHRVARGMGGSSERNTIVNAVLLSKEAHRLAESRDEDMHGMGFWLWSWEDPATEPIMLFSAGGSGRTVWLDESGGYSQTAPKEMA